LIPMDNYFRNAGTMEESVNILWKQDAESVASIQTFLTQSVNL